MECIWKCMLQHVDLSSQPNALGNEKQMDSAILISDLQFLHCPEPDKIDQECINHHRTVSLFASGVSPPMILIIITQVTTPPTPPPPKKNAGVVGFYPYPCRRGRLSSIPLQFPLSVACWRQPLKILARTSPSGIFQWWGSGGPERRFSHRKLVVFVPGPGYRGAWGLSWSPLTRI